MTKYYANLHTHTKISDGEHSPIELIDAATERDLVALAMTDHDRVPHSEYNGENLREYALRKGICLLPNCIELNSEGDVHIGGYLLNLSNEAAGERLRDYEKRAVRERSKQSEKVCRAEQLPMDIDKENPQTIHLIDYAAEEKYDGDWQDAHTAVKSRTKQYPRKQISPGEATDLLRGLDSIVICLHPLLKEFRECEPILYRADGAEARYPYFQQFFKKDYVIKQPERTIKAALELLDERADYFEIPWLDWSEKRGRLNNLTRDYDSLAESINDLFYMLTCKIAEKIVKKKKRPMLLTGGSDFHGRYKPHISLESAGLDEREFMALVDGISEIYQARLRRGNPNPEIEWFLKQNGRL